MIHNYLYNKIYLYNSLKFSRPPKFGTAPEKWWLEDALLLGRWPSGAMLNFWDVILNVRVWSVVGRHSTIFHDISKFRAWSPIQKTQYLASCDRETLFTAINPTCLNKSESEGHQHRCLQRLWDWFACQGLGFRVLALEIEGGPGGTKGRTTCSNDGVQWASGVFFFIIWKWRGGRRTWWTLWTLASMFTGIYSWYYVLVVSFSYFHTHFRSENSHKGTWRDINGRTNNWLGSCLQQQDLVIIGGMKKQPGWSGYIGYEQLPS